jgi:GNAT superfamily N-acetyltransferase
VYFYALDLQTLEGDLLDIGNRNDIMVSDCIGIDLSEIINIFERCGFIKYVGYSKMKRVIGGDDVFPDVDIVFPNVDKAGVICDMFDDNFDRFAEQLPTIDEMRLMLKNKEVLSVMEGDDIAGVLIRKPTPKTSVLMFYLVSPKYRNRKIGSKLLNYYLNEYKGGMITLWVLSNNENGISVYSHFGFTMEKVIDQIMINKDLYYEARNN